METNAKGVVTINWEGRGYEDSDWLRDRAEINQLFPGPVWIAMDEDALSIQLFGESFSPETDDDTVYGPAMPYTSIFDFETKNAYLFTDGINERADRLADAATEVIEYMEEAGLAKMEELVAALKMTTDEQGAMLENITEIMREGHLLH